MAIRRYTAIADTTITNAYKSNLTTRGDDSNMGRSDVLEIFSIYAQATADSTEQARILIKFSDETIDELETFKDNTDFKVFLKVFTNFSPCIFMLTITTLLSRRMSYNYNRSASIPQAVRTLFF